MTRWGNTIKCDYRELMMTVWQAWNLYRVRFLESIGVKIAPGEQW